MQNPLRNLPSVNELLESPPLKRMVNRVNHSVVVNGARSILDELRGQLKQAAEQVSVPTPHEIATRVADWVARAEKPKLRPVINGTGILLHTGLGRAPLSDEAVAAVASISAGYASLEIDLDSGQRSQRADAVRDLLCELTGAEDAVIVNNNAAATMLTLSALAAGSEVVVSRGQLIEIGGSYRLPDVMRMSGAVLKEVGTTNKTRISDYADAIGEQTGALLKVHPSNYVVMGFSESVEIGPLADLGHEHKLPVIDDIGSGALFDFSPYGLHDEPIVSHSLEQGADVVLFSGDKLVGGPQCGIIVGRKKYLKHILKHPLMRAMRVDKVTLAALAATLRVYRDRSAAEQSIPLLAMLATKLDNLRHRAERLAPQLQALEGIASADVIESHAMLGGGSMPTQEIPSVAIAMEPAGMRVDRLAQLLRNGVPALMGRVANDRLLLDFRSISPKHDVDLVACVSQALGASKQAAQPDTQDSPSAHEVDDA